MRSSWVQFPRSHEHLAAGAEVASVVEVTTSEPLPGCIGAESSASVTERFVACSKVRRW